MDPRNWTVKERSRSCRLTAMRKHYTPAFKAQVVRDILREDKLITQIASEHGVHRNVLHSWKAQALAGLPGLFEGQDDVAQLREAHEW